VFITFVSVTLFGFSADCFAGADGFVVVAVTGVPHDGQNFSPFVISVPHFVQVAMFFLLK
jgi:hypothetical protein